MANTHGLRSFDEFMELNKVALTEDGSLGPDTGPQVIVQDGEDLLGILSSQENTALACLIAGTAICAFKKTAPTAYLVETTWLRAPGSDPTVDPAEDPASCYALIGYEYTDGVLVNHAVVPYTIGDTGSYVVVERDYDDTTFVLMGQHIVDASVPCTPHEAATLLASNKFMLVIEKRLINEGAE